MATPTVDFYWDVGSTNTYFAVFLLPEILQRTGASVRWLPFNLGYVFRYHDYTLGQEPAAKLRHRARDLERWAARAGLAFRFPEKFPIKTSRPLRGAIAMRRWGVEQPYIEAIFRAYWERGEDVSEYASLRSIAGSLSVDPNDFEKESEGEAARSELIRTTNEGLERGAFGAPTFFVGSEMFWGKDRLDFLEAELHRAAST